MRFNGEQRDRGRILLNSMYDTLRQRIKTFPYYVLPFGVFTLISAYILFIDSSWHQSSSSSFLHYPQVSSSVMKKTSMAVPGYETTSTSSSGPYYRDRVVKEPRSGSHSHTKRAKPIMHTFWDPVPGGCCGADEAGHQQLIDAWRGAWGYYGWETKILTMDDVIAHPEYERMTNLFKKFYIAEYDKRCFYRWLAMGNQPNGGWMSDYDVFPMHFTARDTYALLERNGNGNFTSYSNVAPALLYANQDEWNRVIQILMSYMSQDIFRGPLMTDMYVFKQAVEEHRHELGIIYGPDQFVSRIGFNLYKTDRHTLECGLTKGLKAVHFSHHSCILAEKEGRFPLKKGKRNKEWQYRGLAAAMFISDFENQCLHII